MTVWLQILVQDRTFADALAARLEADPDFEVVVALHARPPSPQLFTGSRADVVLLDADFPDDTAFSLCEELSRRGQPPYVALLSHSADPQRIIRGIKAGAVVGWVRKDESLDHLISVVHGVARGETWLPRENTGDVLRLLIRGFDGEHANVSGPLASLTQREREVLVCLAEGSGRRDMAEHLHMSPNTVRTHLQNLMAKLGVHSALEAVALTRSRLDDHLPPGGIVY
jgi:DNA-binding NarL/FixJ family response regulator